MNTRHATAARATALGLAVFATLSILVSVDWLATPSAAEVQMARQQASTPVVAAVAVRPANT